MKITICSSVNFTPQIKQVSDELCMMGHETNIPATSKRIICGELKLEEFAAEKEKNGDQKFRNHGNIDFIKKYYDYIKASDAILVLNLDKKGIKNYIGGNVLMEIGFAHILNKKIYFYNSIPEMAYSDELKAVRPIIIKGDLKRII